MNDTNVLALIEQLEDMAERCEAARMYPHTNTDTVVPDVCAGDFHDTLKDAANLLRDLLTATRRFRIDGENIYELLVDTANENCVFLALYRYDDRDWVNRNVWNKAKNLTSHNYNPKADMP